MLIIELNEFSSELLETASSKCSLPNISKILGMSHSRTMAVEDEERFGLDPWVQWVSIHTGLPAKKHGILHLGDASKLKEKQLWEALAENGHHYGVWGCMNAKFRPVEGCDFFLPDPWTFSEQAHPKNLNHFFAFPRYYAKNYLDLKILKVIKTSMHTLYFLLRHLFTFLPLSFFVIKSLFKAGINNASLFAVFDLMSAACFSRYRKIFNSEFAVVFLNSVAHYQHHRWPEETNFSEKDLAFFHILDKALEILLATTTESEPIIFLNAFSQHNTAFRDETLYRQKNPEGFFEAIGLSGFRLEQLMTNDSQLIFSTTKELMKAEEVLLALQINGQQAFQVDIREDEKLMLFCQFIIWEHIGEDSNIILKDGTSLLFFDYFDTVVKRTGSHTQEGDIYYRKMNLPDKIINHEIYSHILHHYGIKSL